MRDGEPVDRRVSNTEVKMGFAIPSLNRSKRKKGAVASSDDRM